MQLTRIVLIMLFLSSCSQLPAESNDDSPAWNEVEPEAFAYQDEQEGYKSTDLEVALGAGQSMELKFNMEKNDTIVYQWKLKDAVDGQFLTEFHGNTEKPPGTLVFYKKHENLQEQGSLTAAFSGDHGWYFENNSQSDAVIQLSAAGWYNQVKEIPIAN